MSFFNLTEADFYSSQSSVSPIRQVSPIDRFQMPLETFSSVILLSLAFGIIWSKKHRVRQQRLNQQRALLERIWEMSPSK